MAAPHWVQRGGWGVQQILRPSWGVECRRRKRLSLRWEHIGGPDLQVGKNPGCPPRAGLRRQSKRAHDCRILESCRIPQSRPDTAPTPPPEEELQLRVASVTRSATTPAQRMPTAVPPRRRAQDFQELVLRAQYPLPHGPLHPKPQGGGIVRKTSSRRILLGGPHPRCSPPAPPRIQGSGRILCYGRLQ